MDPAACVQFIAEALGRGDQADVDSQLHDLWDWVDKHGFLPVLAGPVLGTRPHPDIKPVCGIVTQVITRVTSNDGTIVLRTFNCAEWKIEKYKDKHHPLPKEEDLVAFRVFPNDLRDAVALKGKP